MIKLLKSFAASRIALATLLHCALALAFGTYSWAGEVEFLRDVRPILSGHCFKCHGPDEEARKAKLRLDIREEALKPTKSGQAAIVPGKPDDSELIRRVFAHDEDDVMPPPAAKLPLTEKDKTILKEWIVSGAEYKAHWAFLKPRQPPLPQVDNSSWPKNEIDYYVLSRLEKEGLAPSKPADNYTLVRRVFLDLIGFPPTPEQADAFVNDTSPNAYERLVDGLLQSPHYGERWARRWLDLARYADTNGYEKDRPRSMWPYRDWVIRALNEDMPFDQFTIEQLAGDLLPNATMEQRIATGFHRNTMINEEGGIDPLEYRFYSMVDRVHVTATTWLGLTMACAQCHTHKFDPIQHGEYYKFMAFLNNADEPRIDVLDEKITAERKVVEARIAELEAKLADEFPPEPNLEWKTLTELAFTAENGSEAELLLDGSFRVSGKNPDKDTYILQGQSSAGTITHLQVEAIPDEKVAGGGPGRTDHGNFVLTDVELEVQESSAEPRKIKFARAEADFEQNGFPAGNSIDGKSNTGWAIARDGNLRTHRRAIFTLAEPISIGKETKVTIKLLQQYGGRHTLGRFRVSLGSDLSGDKNVARGQAHLEKKFAKWLEGEKRKWVPWRMVRPDEALSEKPLLTIEPDGAVYASGDFTKSDTYHLAFKNAPLGVTAIRFEVLPDDRLPSKGPGTVRYEGPEGDFWFSNLKVRAGGKNIALKNPSESFASGDNNAAKAIDNDLQSGWSINGGQGRTHNAVFQLDQATAEVGPIEIDMTFERYFAAGLGRFRVYLTTADNATASALSEEASKILAQPDYTESDRQILLREFLAAAPELEPKRKEIEKLRREMPNYPTTLIMAEWPPGRKRATHRYHRGEFLQPREKVDPDVPAFLPPFPANAPRTRLGLAKWLVSPENPLTARVTMNRHWEAFFGRGLVRTMEDFGFQGELPTHPDLLDWLAMEFINRGWSQKKMHKLIVMSATYQQSTHVTPELQERDPENLLLARGPRVRLEAELIRDAALAGSGLLSRKLGGPSVFPPQPPGVSTEGAYGPLQWKVSEGPDRYRRGLYTFAKRTAPYAMTATFDGPSGEACLARRERSNTPLQALTLLNDAVFMESARVLGRWASEQKYSVDEIVQQLFRRCLTRPPSETECGQIADFYNAQLKRFQKGELNAEEILAGSKGEGSSEQAAWTAVARVILNLDETITKS